MQDVTVFVLHNIQSKHIANRNRTVAGSGTLPHYVIVCIRVIECVCV